MNITSATFVKGIVGEDEILEGNVPQIAFIGRSNVGKSSIINSLAKKKIAITSSFPGRTQQINVYYINKSFYLLDLPGYGFSKGSKDQQNNIQQLIYWYFFSSPYNQSRVFLIIDAEIGLTKTDMDFLHSLIEADKDVVIIANKIDKIKKSFYKHQLDSIHQAVGQIPLIPYSAEKNVGIGELVKAITQK